ncbi:MAG: nucleotide exchange factor GrpE [Candidatus Nanoarchaeia archaeon]
MVFSRFTQALNSNDEKYEILMHKYSALKSQHKQLQKNVEREKEEHEFKTGKKFATELMNVYETYERAKEQSFKVNATSNELQRFMIEFNAVGKQIDKAMKQNGIEVYDAQERFYDTELHELGSYQSANGMQKGIILKTTRKGCKFRNQLVKKPRVVVTN